MNAALAASDNADKFKAVHGQLLAVIERDPSVAKPYLDLGELLLQSGRVVEALSVLEKATDLEPGFAAAHYHTARALTTLGAHSDAVFAYRRCLDVAPEHAAAWCGVAEAVIRLSAAVPGTCSTEVARARGLWHVCGRPMPCPPGKPGCV